MTVDTSFTSLKSQTHHISDTPLNTLLCHSEKYTDSGEVCVFSGFRQNELCCVYFFSLHNYPRIPSERTVACWTGSQDPGGIWRRGCEQSINTEAVAARNTRVEPADESQASNDKQIRPGYTEMEPADVFTVRFQT